MRKKKLLSGTAAEILNAEKEGRKEEYEPDANVLAVVYGPTAFFMPMKEDDSEQHGIQESTEDSEGSNIQEN